MISPNSVKQFGIPYGELLSSYGSTSGMTLTITFGNIIILTPADFATMDPTLINHELGHVRQFETMGVLFYAIYVGDAELAAIEAFFRRSLYSMCDAHNLMGLEKEADEGKMPCHCIQ